MENADKTVFYWRFCQSAYCTAAINEKRSEHHAAWYAYVEDAAQRHNMHRHADVLFMMSAMVEGTLMSAVKVLHENKETVDSLTTDTVFRAVFAQIFAIFDAERQGSES